MTPKQRSLYFGTLWPKACAVQGWNPKDDARRQAVTLEATGKTSAGSLNQSLLSALFDHLKWLADPYSLEAALPAANPEIGEENHRRRQLVWRITQTAAKAGLGATWLKQASAAKCREHGVGVWGELPLPELLKFSFSIATATKEEAKARRASRGRKATAAGLLQSECSEPAETVELPF
jgi:hypothetical protein